MWRGFSCCVLGGMMVLLGGCNRGGGVDVVPVSGTVMLDGQPLDGATVMFVPVEGGAPASGLTNAQGVFQLMTAGADVNGAKPGSYKVTVSKRTGPVEDAPMTQEEGMKRMQEQMAGGMANLGKKPPAQKDEVPSKYTSAETTDLTAQVQEAGQNNFQFDLSSSG